MADKKVRFGVVEMEGTGADGYDDARAMRRPQLGPITFLMLNFNEGKICDAIIRPLEARANGSRSLPALSEAPNPRAKNMPA
jgi:hypothetical protein